MTFDRPLGSTYVLGPLLGRGSMGRVYRARLRGGNGEVAVKLLRDDWSDDDEIMARFLREKRVLAALDHPNIVKVLDLVVDGGDVGIVMELVPGGDLRRLLGKGPMPSAEVVTLAHQLSLALQAAHSASVVHGDVKPENILVASTEPLVVKLSDFGVARLVDATAAKSSSRVGTPTYMAPELVDDAPVGPPADIYSVGVLLYEALAGRPPFVATSPVALWRAHASTEPSRPEGLGDAWWELLQRMLAKSAADRPGVGDLARSFAAGSVHANLLALGSPADEGEATLQRGGGVDRETVDSGSVLPTVIKPRTAVDTSAVQAPGRLRPARTAAAALAVLAVAGVVAWTTGLFPSRAGVAQTMATASAGSTAQASPTQPPGAPSRSGTAVQTLPPSSSAGSIPSAHGPSPQTTDGLNSATTMPRKLPIPIPPTKVVPVQPAVSSSPRTPARTSPVTTDTTRQCQASSNPGGLDIGPALNNSGGPNFVPTPCTSIWLKLTHVEYITYAKACLEDSAGADTRCGSWVYLKDNGAWNKLLDRVSPGSRWQLYLKAEGQGFVGFQFSG